MYNSDFFQKNKKQQQSFLPVFEPLNMSAAAIPQMAGGEGREGQLFNPLQCKHDPFEWRGISQDILVWADLPKQPRTTVALLLVLQRQIFKIQEQHEQFEFVQNQRLKGCFFSAKCVSVCMRAQHSVHIQFVLVKQ